MEDAGVAVDSLALKSSIPNDQLVGLWAVFDGVSTSYSYVSRLVEARVLPHHKRQTPCISF